MSRLNAGGGVARSTFELLSGLRALGTEPSVVCLKDTGLPSMREEFQGHGIPVAMIQGDWKAKIRALRRIIESGRIDVAHTTFIGSKPTTVARLASVGLPVALVTSLVDIPKSLDSRGGPALTDRWTRRLTDRFHAISLAMKSYAILELGIPERRITVIERGRDLGRLGAPSIERRLRARAALGIDPETPMILTAGRQDPAKDQATLLAAFDRLGSLHPKALLLIAGREGRCTSLLFSRRELSPYRHRIRILGHRDDVPELMAAADVFAFPSVREGFGGAAIEAMALGLPVVTSDIPTLREVVAEAGVFAPPGDSDAFARELSRLLQDPERARSLGVLGQRRFMERFTIERSAQRMRDLYTELLPARARVRARADG